MKRQNDAARDLWAQIFERAAAEPNATLHVPDEESDAIQRDLTAKAYKAAGWSEVEIARRKESEGFHGLCCTNRVTPWVSLSPDGSIPRLQ
jgi:hypothetical protein